MDNINCPFCGREDLPVPNEIQWHLTCPGCGAHYWIGPRTIFTESIASLLFTFRGLAPENKTAIAATRRQLRRQSKIRRRQLTEAVFVQL